MALTGRSSEPRDRCRHALVALAGGMSVAAACAAGCAWQPPAEAAAARLPLTPCHVEGLAEEVRCGVLEVPENRAGASGRRVPIHVAVVPATTRKSEPDPFVLLAGGPGQGAIGYAGWAATVFRKVRSRRDVVLVDLRGTGASAPLKCGSSTEGLPLLVDPQAWLHDLAACPARLDADPRFYSNLDAMEDLDEVRAALGYARINLWGGSYGTRAAMVYLRLHPDRVRSVVLDGAAPFSLRFPLTVAADAQRALDLLLDRCEADAACKRTYPALRRSLEGLRRRVQATPARAEVRHPLTGARAAVELDWSEIASIVRGALYLPQQAALLPWIVARAAEDDFGPLLAAGFAVSGWSVDTMSLGATLSVLCTEDLPRVTEAEARRAAEGSFVGTTQYDFWARACRGWPVRPLPEGFDAPIRSEVPALVLSGGLDPVTPPHRGEAAAAEFTRARHVVVPWAAHNTTPVGCVPDLIDVFIRAGHGDALDASCAERASPLPFFLGPAPASGPVPGPATAGAPDTEVEP